MHEPEGLENIAQRVHGLAGVFAQGLKKLGTVETANAHAIADAARKSEINLQVVDVNIVSVAFCCIISAEYHTEHELLRYIHGLQSKDLSLCHSMIPKLNATEMMPLTWPSFANIHPFAPTEQAQGYQARGDHHHNVCIIPVSAHGTNPASVNIEELGKTLRTTYLHLWYNLLPILEFYLHYLDNLGIWKGGVTYPSTRGVYEEGIDEICKIIHDNGGQ
ncbi:hypothetical protein JHK87_008979 [Glycine soja]|nr:hypothetical protein JHK87_008979 [Glycine soja]